MKRAVIFLVFMLALGISACKSTEQRGTTTVLIVRHAEKASDAEDSPLTEAGMRRAQALVRVAEEAGVSAIYSTQFKRNRDTAQPLASRLGVAVTEVPVNLQNPGDHGKLLAGEIMAKHPGAAVVVIGHSNTIPSIVEALSGRAVSFNSVEYQELFIITIPPTGPARVIKAQYGL